MGTNTERRVRLTQGAEGRACAKAILLGEHFVVHGGLALAVPLRSLWTQVQLEPSEADAEVEVYSEVSGPEPARAITRAAELLGVDARGATARVRSDVPLGCGLGSSASFAVAVARALCAAGGVDASPERVSDVALDLERGAHGNPSGVDNAVIALERAVSFRRGSAPLPLRRPQAADATPTLHLVVADSGARFPTSEAVARVAAYRERHSEVFRSLLADADALVARGVRAFESGDAATLAEAMRENHAMLREVGVSSEALDELVRDAERAGALAAKLTGGGVGGSVIALVRPSAVEPIRAAMAAAGATRVISSPL